MAVVVVLVVFVFPTRTYLEQHHQIELTAAQLRATDQANATMAAEAQKLQTDAEIERLAREQYHLVRPGEEAFGILPAAAPSTPTSLATAAAAHSSSGAGGWWHDLTSWWP